MVLFSQLFDSWSCGQFSNRTSTLKVPSKGLFLCKAHLKKRKNTYDKAIRSTETHV